MARGRRGAHPSAALVRALSADDLRAEVHAVVDAARGRVDDAAWERECARLGIVDGHAGLDAYLQGSPTIDEDVALMSDVSATVDLLDPDTGAALRRRAGDVLQLRADWASAAHIRFGSDQIQAWMLEPGEDASADHWRWWQMAQVFGAQDPDAVRRGATTQAQGWMTVTDPSGIQRAAAAATHGLRLRAEVGPELAARISDLLLSDADDALIATYVDEASGAMGMARTGARDALDDGAHFDPARRLAQAYADAGRDAPLDLMLPHHVDEATLARHGHERRAGRAAQAHDDALQRAAGYTHTAGAFAHVALRALEAGEPQVVVPVRASDMAEVVIAHAGAPQMRDLHFCVREHGDDSQLVAVMRLAGTINGEVRSVIAESVLLHAHGHDDLTRQRLAEQAAPWLAAHMSHEVIDGAGCVTGDVDEVLRWRPAADFSDLHPPSSAPSFSSPAQMLDVTPCAHEDVHWEENRDRDARVLCCHGCGARHLAVVPLHRVPGATIQPAKAYMARECFHAALEGREVPARSLAALRRVEGEVDMSPRAHLPSLFVFPDEQDIASALFG